MTVFDHRVVPRFLYSRAVIAAAVSSRHRGASWEQATAGSSADGRLDVSTVKRWQRRFQVLLGQLTENLPPATPFRRSHECEILGRPAGSRSSEPSQEDPWARSPPQP